MMGGVTSRPTRPPTRRAVAAAALFLLVSTAVAPAAFAAGPGAPSTRIALLDAGAAAGKASSRLELLTLRRIFSTIGVPADVLSDVQRLSDYQVVFTAGELVNTAVTPDLSNGLFDFVEGGGTLVSAGEVGNLLYPLFALTRQAPSRKRYRLGFVTSDPLTAFMDHPNERTISLGNGAGHFFDDVIWSHGASLAPGASAVGSFEDGSVGLSVFPFGRGKAYLLGLSYTNAVLLPQIGGSYNAERQYVNGVEPSADVVMLILKAICGQAVSPLVSLSTVPYASPVGLVLSHDVDAQSSFLDSLKFADLEAKYGVKSTFFITTKYFTDESDIGYFTVPENLAAVRELRRRGWEVGSHTVSHLTKLADAPEGDPGVTQKTYDPPAHLTVWGEARVSKELLDREVPGPRTMAYRSGDLAFPRALIRVLEGSGYSYDSTYSSNAVLTAFPYVAFEDQDLGSRESSVLEIPVTFDDSQGYLTPANASAVAGDWLDVIRTIARYGGLPVLLMHPSDTRTKTYKLQAQELIMKAVAGQGGWMGDLSTAGKFWRSRAAVHFTAEAGTGGSLVIRVDARREDLDPAIGFEVTGAVRSVTVVDRDGKTLPYAVVSRGGKLYAGRKP
jgi:peptidoglycan/xylan/chitin deacetylase (PgdA/CDA1 family)